MSSLENALHTLTLTLARARESALLGVVAGAMLLCGCGGGGAPEPVAIGDAPAAIEKSFAGAQGETKTEATAAAAAVQAGDYTRAFFTLSQLTSRPDLTPEQREAASRSFMAVSEQVRQAAERGDANARQAIEVYRTRK